MTAFRPPYHCLHTAFRLSSDCLHTDCRLTTFWLLFDCLIAADCCLTVVWLLSKYHLTAYWLLIDCLLTALRLPSDMYSATYSNGWKLKCCWCSLYHCWATLTMATTVIIYIYQKKLLLARIVLVMGFQIWPKVQQKTCWRTLLPCPSTGSKIDCANQNDFWVHQKCNCIYCCSKNEFTTWNHLLVWHKKWFWRFF